MAQGGESSLSVPKRASLHCDPQLPTYLPQTSRFSMVQVKQTNTIPSMRDNSQTGQIQDRTRQDVLYLFPLCFD